MQWLFFGFLQQMTATFIDNGNVQAVDEPIHKMSCKNDMSSQEHQFANRQFSFEIPSEVTGTVAGRADYGLSYYRHRAR